MKSRAKRILLIHPPFYRLFKQTYSLERHPLFLGYLAGIIRRDTDWKVKTYNADFYPHSEVIRESYMANRGFNNYQRGLAELSGDIWEEIRATIREFKPGVIGISIQSPLLGSAYAVAKIAKEIDEDMIVVVGGSHVSAVGRDLLHIKSIDVCVMGEGENTTVELLNAIKEGKKLDSIPGLIFRKNGSIVENSSRSFIEDMDSLPFPHETAPEVLKDYDLFPRKAFKNILTTRGCPYNCSFCASQDMWGRRTRFRSPSNVVQEIKCLQKRGLHSIRFEDETFGFDKKYLREFCNELMVECPGITWECELHVNLVDEPTISLLKKAGCFKIQIGIESGNNEILRAIRKNITIEDAYWAATLIKKSGLLLEVFFMIGFPQETEETLYDTIDALKKIKCDRIICNIFTPYPGTDAFDLCKRKGWIKNDHNFALYFHQSPENYFCREIPYDKFKALTSQIEKITGRRNAWNTVRMLCSRKILLKIQEMGVKKSLQKGIRSFFSRVL